MEKAEKFKGGKKSIVITDSEVIDMIKDIMSLPEYGKSFNKAVNHALKLGIVELYERLFIKGQTNEPEEIDKMSVKQTIMTPAEKYEADKTDEMIRLLGENIMHLTMIKSVTNSLFNARAAEYGGTIIPKSKFEDGLYRRTPKYLESYEKRAIKNIRGEQ